MTAGEPGHFFFEWRRLRRGPMIVGNAAIGVVLAVVGVWLVRGPDLVPLRVLCLVAGVLLVVPVFCSVVTTVSAGVVTIAVPPVRRRVIPVDDVVGSEIVVADHLVPLFGGWNVRGSISSALAASVEGDRSVGNRAVLLTMRSGDTHQVGSWRPSALVRAIEEAQACGRRR